MQEAMEYSDSVDKRLRESTLPPHVLETLTEALLEAFNAGYACAMAKGQK